ncbi:hypothetical protein ACFL4T_04005 [candidate division KSB1 bacterium]
MKRIITLISFLSLVVIINISAFSQEINYSGKWKIDLKKSSLPGMTIKDHILTIMHEGINLNIKSELIWPNGNRDIIDYKYTTDGKDCTIPGRYIEELTGRCLIEKGELSIEREQDGIRRVRGKQETIYTTIIEKYSLSKDGKILTIIRTSLIGNRAFKSKMVFQKVD